MYIYIFERYICLGAVRARSARPSITKSSACASTMAPLAPVVSFSSVSNENASFHAASLAAGALGAFALRARVDAQQQSRLRSSPFPQTQGSYFFNPPKRYRESTKRGAPRESRARSRAPRRRGGPSGGSCLVKRPDSSPAVAPKPCHRPSCVRRNFLAHFLFKIN